MYLVINKCVTAVKVSNFSCHYLRNRSTLGIGVLGYIGVVQHKEHSPEVLSIPPGTPCIYIYIHTHTPLKLLAPPLIYTFTPVITTYQFHPYKIDKYYVVSFMLITTLQ